MKSKLFMLLSTVLMLAAACSPQKSDKAYTITGTAEGTQDGDTVFICEMQGFFEMIPVDIWGVLFVILVLHSPKSCLTMRV